MKIAITGANGFIAKNLILRLHNYKKNKIYEITRSTKKKTIDEIINHCDLIFHLAAANRTINSKSFKKDNIDLTNYICQHIIKNNLKKKIIFSSSTQISKNSFYGFSKKKCEKILIDLTKINPSKVVILRLPNIFGKFCKPNYNSVVSTFCYNISRDKKIKISNPKNKINLLYIDDLVELFIDILKKNIKKNQITTKFNKSINISLLKLSKIIYQFEEERKSIFISNLDCQIKKNLYATYVSLLPKNKITYPLRIKKDSRGSFTEFLKTQFNGQISIFTAKKNQIRGCHYHNTKVEKFLVIKGKAKFVMKNLSTMKETDFILSDKIFKVIESIPGTLHYIKNIGNSDLIVLLWSNELFNNKKPDTYSL